MPTHKRLQNMNKCGINSTRIEQPDRDQIVIGANCYRVFLLTVNQSFKLFRNE